MASTGPNVSTAASGYFVDQKKGEVNELKQLLRNLNVEKDVKRKREIIKKVIAYMTLGIDVSRLFTDMIMAIETKDIVIKKMVYLYLCNYAHKQPDMAIMCINSLRRDCDNEDPMVRGLALRSLCNLRLESILEYVEQPIQKSLTDISPYVRKTGVMGVLKLNDLSPTFVESHNYMPQLYSMLQDVDANVVTNVIMVLNELLLDEGGMLLTQGTVMMLLNRLGEFSEWGLNAVLDLVSRYSPSNEDEIFAIMNLLDPVLRTANSGAVLATLKCFMKLAGGFVDLLPQIFARAKPPMLTFVTGANFEVQFAALKHLQVMLYRPQCKGVFDSEFRQFFVRYNEPSHVKQLKVDLLPLIANDSNAKDISTELSEYVVDVDAELSRRSINALGEIAMRVAGVSNEITQTLLELVDFDIPYVRAQAVKNLANIVRVFPAVRVHILPVISKCLRKVDDASAKSAIIWMLGEYGEEVIEAPYYLEPIIDNYDDEPSAQIKLHLLTATTQLFFKRPPEVRAMLGRLLSAAVNDSSNQDVHDRALLYYRLLGSSDVDTARSMFAASRFVPASSTNSTFAEDQDDDLRNKIYAEFNTLAVIFGAPSNQFIAEDYQLKLANAPLTDSIFDAPQIGAGNSAPTGLSTQPTPAQAQAERHSFSLLDFSDVPAAVPTNFQASPPLRLAQGTLSPQQFQQLWTSTPETYNGRLTSLNHPVLATSDIENWLRGLNINTMASGPLAGGEQGYKFFIFGFDVEGPVYLMQMSVFNSSREVSAVVKSLGPSTTKFLELVGSAFAN